MVELARRHANHYQIEPVMTDPNLNEPALDVAHLTRQRAFSTETFGPGVRTGMVTDHIRKELVEIENSPTDITEWADLILLSFDGALRAGHEPVDIIKAVRGKLQKNMTRTWPDWRTADPDKAIEHTNTEETD